jgi:hypothetical protein
VAIAGDRLQLVVTSTVDRVEWAGPSRPEGQWSFLVSVPLGAAPGVRADVAALGERSPLSVWPGGAPDRVVCSRSTGEAVWADMVVDVMGPGASGGNAGGVGGRWRVLRSWRTPFTFPPRTRSARYVAPLPDMAVLDVTTLRAVTLPGLTETLRSTTRPYREVEAITRNLNYVVTYDPAVSPSSPDFAYTAVDRRTGAATRFPYSMDGRRRLLGVDEAGDGGRGDDLWALYELFDFPDRWEFTLVDRQLAVRRSTSVAGKLRPDALGSLKAFWAPARHLVLFCEVGPMSGERGPVVVRFWDYEAGTTRDQIVDVAGAFRRSWDRYGYVPK